MARQQSLYELLEVSSSATFEEIEQSYQRIAAYLGAESLAVYSILEGEDAASMRSQLDEAFRTLSDPDRRAAYDRARREEQSYPPITVPASHRSSDASMSHSAQSHSASAASRDDSSKADGNRGDPRLPMTGRPRGKVTRPPLRGPSERTGRTPLYGRSVPQRESRDDDLDVKPRERTPRYGRAMPGDRSNDEPPQRWAVREEAAREQDREEPRQHWTRAQLGQDEREEDFDDDMDSGLSAREPANASRQSAGAWSDEEGTDPGINGAQYDEGYEADGAYDGDYARDYEAEAREEQAREDARRLDDARSEARRLEEARVRVEEARAEERRAEVRRVEDARLRADELRAEERRAEERRAEERRAEERRAEERRAEEWRAEERRAEERRVEERRAEERRQDEQRRAEEWRAEDRRAEERRNDERRNEERRQDAYQDAEAARPELVKTTSDVLEPRQKSRVPLPPALSAGARPKRRVLTPSLSIDIGPDTEFGGAMLRRLRESTDASLDEVAEITKVSKRYLVAIETNDFAALPAAVYTRGFVAEYARVLGLDPNVVTKSFMSLYAKYRGVGG